MQDRKASIEFTEGEAYDKDLISDEYGSDFKDGMQKLRDKLKQFQGGAKVRPYTSARSLRDTSRPFLPAVYVQMRTDSFRFFEVLDKVYHEFEEEDLEMLRKVRLLFDIFFTFSSS